MKASSKELSFLVKLIAVIIAASLLSFGILYLLMNTWIGTDYAQAFQQIKAVYQKMNLYIAAAVVIQFIVSCFVVWLLALHYSHKVAGPIYRLKVTIQQFKQGADVEKVFFRKTDLLHDIAGNFTNFFILLGRRKKIFEKISACITASDLSRTADRQEAVQTIKKHLENL